MGGTYELIASVDTISIRIGRYSKSYYSFFPCLGGLVIRAVYVTQESYKKTICVNYIHVYTRILLQDLLYVVPFVAKVVESCAESRVFKPPNPWTMGIMAVLSELHSLPNLKVCGMYM